MMTIKQLQKEVEECRAKAGKTHTLQVFCNYLSERGYLDAAHLLCELQRDMLIEQGEWKA